MRAAQRPCNRTPPALAAGVTGHTRPPHHSLIKETGRRGKFHRQTYKIIFIGVCDYITQQRVCTAPKNQYSSSGSRLACLSAALLSIKRSFSFLLKCAFSLAARLACSFSQASALSTARSFSTCFVGV